MQFSSSFHFKYGSYVRWKVAGLLFLVTLINYLDRQSFSVAAPVILKEFSLTQTQYGAITSAFLLAYAIGQALSGRLIDRIGTKRAFTWAVTLWSLACMVCALGRGYFSFMSMRAALGFFESMNHPTAVKTISEWFPASERPLGVGIFLAGASVGIVVAPPLLATAIFYVNWQFAFVLAGSIGFLWLIVWRKYYQPPETHPGMTDQERTYVLENRATVVPDEQRPSIWALLKHKEVFGLALARFVGDNIFLFFTFWLPLFLAQEHGLNILEIGFFAWVPFLFTDIGSVVAGWFSGQLMRWGFSLNAARKIMLGIAAVMVPISIFAVWADSPLTAVLLIGFAMFFNQFKSVTALGLPGDLFPARDVATVWGYLGAAGSFGGVLFSPLIGWSIENFSFTPVFVAVAFTPAIVMALVLIFVPEVRQIHVSAEPKAPTSPQQAE